VKRRGKSPPRHWRQCRKDSGSWKICMSFTCGKTQSRFPVKSENGKPHQEQSQAAHAYYAPAVRRSSAGRLLKCFGNEPFRQMAVLILKGKTEPGLRLSLFLTIRSALIRYVDRPFFFLNNENTRWM